MLNVNQLRQALNFLHNIIFYNKPQTEELPDNISLILKFFKLKFDSQFLSKHSWTNKCNAIFTTSHVSKNHHTIFNLIITQSYKRLIGTLFFYCYCYMYFLGLRYWSLKDVTLLLYYFL